MFKGSDKAYFRHLEFMVNAYEDFNASAKIVGAQLLDSVLIYDDMDFIRAATVTDNWSVIEEEESGGAFKYHLHFTWGGIKFTTFSSHSLTELKAEYEV